jgi:hypothetical protein
LEIEPLSGNETTDEVRYRAAYTLWLPFSQQEEEESADAAGGDPAVETSLLPRGVHYTDGLTLVRKRGNWRIAEINRVYNNSSYAEE